LAFFPAPLPRTLALGASVVLRLAEAEAALGRLAGAGRLLPNPHLLVRPYLSREAIASTRIEGTQASLGELFEYEAVGGTLTPDLEEVVNYIRAMETGLALLDTLPISTRLMCRMHQILLDGVRGRDRTPGELRRSQNWIGSPGGTIDDATFVPPPPEELAALLADWERYANEVVELPLLVRAGLLHYQFETIHPFLDGNGRLGRLLIVFFLVANGRLPSPILYLSPYFEEHREEYYQHLQHVRERGELDEWLTFFLDGVEIQANDAVARAERLVDLREQYRQRVARVTRSNALAVVDIAFDSPVLTSRVVESRLAVTRPTALSLLQQLADLDVLVEHATGPRGQRRWMAQEIMQIVTG
jgi:Fic family protein